MTSPGGRFPDALVPHAPAAWRSWLLDYKGPSITEKAQRQQLAADIRLLDLTPRTGWAWFPCTTDGFPGLDGFIAAVHADAGTPDREIEPVLQDQVRRWLAVAAGVEPEEVPCPRLHLDLPRGHVVVDGHSLGLAAAVAALSKLLGVPPQTAPLCSALLDFSKPLSVGAVRGVPAKERVVALECPGVPALVASAGGSVGEWLDRWLAPDWRVQLAKVLERSPDALVEDAWRFYRATCFQEALSRASAAIPAAEGHCLGEARWLRGACRMHRGEDRLALQDLDAARQILEGPPAEGELPGPAWRREELDAFLGIALLDNGRPQAGIPILEAHLAAWERLPDPLDLRTRQVALQVAGTLHRLLVVDGRAEEALRVQRHWLLGRGRVTMELARAWGDVAEVHRRLGDLEAARRALADAEAATRHIPSEHRGLTRQFQAIFRVRAGIEPARWPVRPPCWSDAPETLETLETLLSGPPTDLDQWADEYVAGQKVPFVWLLVLGGTAARSMLEAHRGAPDWALDVVDRILTHEPEVDSGIQSALTQLVQGEPTAWFRRSPY